MANRDYYTQEGDYDNASYETEGGFSGNAISLAGRGDFGGLKYLKGAHRFPGVQLSANQNVTNATLILKPTYVEQSGTLRIKTNGIKEANTDPFSSSPFGRPLTTAQPTNNTSVPSVGNTISIDVTAIVNEITHISGWTSGNAMAFVVDNNGSDDYSAIGDEALQSRLIIQQSATPDFTPTPSSVAAPTFPGISSYGIKVSQPGVNVQDATEEQLYFTTRKKQLRVMVEQQTVNVFSIAHGLSYAPCVLGYYNDTGKKYLMHRQIGPFDAGIFIASNTTHVLFSTAADIISYYYQFIDPLT